MTVPSSFLFNALRMSFKLSDKTITLVSFLMNFIVLLVVMNFIYVSINKDKYYILRKLKIFDIY